MPNFFKKKNKSYGVSSKENAAPLGTVRPLSAAFGTDTIVHLDEDEHGKKKSKVRDRGNSKSTKSSNSRSRSTSVPARPKSANFGTHLLAHENVQPKRSQSPGAQRKRSTVTAPTYSQLRGNNALEMESTLPQKSVHLADKSPAQSFVPTTTVIRYTDKKSAVDLWSSTPGDTGKYDPFETVYGNNLSVLDSKSAGLRSASSEEDIPDNPFPREPSIRIESNSYYSQRKLSTFAPENEMKDHPQPLQTHSAVLLNGGGTSTHHIYDEPLNIKPSSKSKPENHYEKPNNHYASVNVELGKKKVPPPPKRSTSLLFEDVAIPSEPYQPLGTFAAPTHSKQRSFETFSGSIVHVTHESTKGIGENKINTTETVIHKSNDTLINERQHKEDRNINDLSHDKTEFTNLNVIMDMQLDSPSDLPETMDKSRIEIDDSKSESSGDEWDDISSHKTDVEIDAISLNVDNAVNVQDKEIVLSDTDIHTLHADLSSLKEKPNQKKVNFVDNDSLIPDSVTDDVSQPGSDYTLRDMDIADQDDKDRASDQDNRDNATDRDDTDNTEMDTSENCEIINHRNNVDNHSNWDIKSSEVSPNFSEEVIKLKNININTSVETNHFNFEKVPTALEKDENSRLECEHINSVKSNLHDWTNKEDKSNSHISVSEMVKSINNKTSHTLINGNIKDSGDETANTENSFNQSQNLFDSMSGEMKMQNTENKIMNGHDHTEDLSSKTETILSDQIHTVHFTKESGSTLNDDDNNISHRSENVSDIPNKEETLCHKKPTIPYKPAILSYLQSSAEQSNLESDQVQNSPFLPKPFLSKPHRFVPSRLIIGQKTTTGSSNKVDNLQLPVITSNKGLFVSQHVGKFSTLSDEKKTSSEKEKNGNISQPKTLVKDQSNHMNKPLLPKKPQEPVKAFAVSEHSTSHKVLFAPKPFKATGSDSSKINPKDSALGNDSVSFLDSLKKRSSVKRDSITSVKKDDLENKDEVFSSVVKEGLSSNIDLTKTFTEETKENIITSDEKVNVTQFLDGLKHTNRGESFRKKTISENEEKDMTGKDEGAQKDKKTKGVLGLLLSPIECKKNKSSNIVKENTLNENTGEKTLSMKEALFREACELPETIIDDTIPHHKLDSSLNTDKSVEPKSFSSLKTIDTISHREQTSSSKAVLSPRQLKRSKGKTSPVKRNSSGEEERFVFVGKRNRTFSDESSVIDDYESHLDMKSNNNCKKNENIDGSSSLIIRGTNEYKEEKGPSVNGKNLMSESSHSFGSEYSAFTPVGSGDEAENSVEEIIDMVPEEFQTVQLNHSFEKGDASKVTEELETKPTPPPRRNRDKRKSKNLDSSLNSDKSSMYSDSHSSGTSTNKELAMINSQKSISNFVPVGENDSYNIVDDNQSEKGVCMPWDNTPWESSNAGSSNSKFTNDDIPDPVLINSDHESENEIKFTMQKMTLDSFPTIDDIPSPQSVSPSVKNEESLSVMINENKEFNYSDKNNETDIHIPKLELNELEEDPPSPVEAREAVSKIFDDTVRLSARNPSVNAQDSANTSFKFERNMRTIRSPSTVNERAIDVQYLENSSDGSTPSKYSERAIDIQDLDTAGKPMAISKHYEERAVDIEGLPEAHVIKSPERKKKRRTSKLSDTSSQYTDQSKSLSPNHSKTGATSLSPKDKISQFDIISQSSSQKTSLTNSTKGYMSPKSTQNFFEEISEFSGLGSKSTDLSNVNLPGLRLNPSAGVTKGPMKGTEHLHPALERSLRTTTVAPRVSSAEVSGHGMLRSIGLDSELMVLVEDDYMTPRPGYNHAVMQNKEVPEPWSIDMLHNWNSNKQIGARPVSVTDTTGLLQRQDSVVSEVSTNTTTTEQRWQVRPIDKWENEDTVDWAEAMGFDELADALHGTGIGGPQLLILEDQLLVDLGIINAELRYQILEEIGKLKEQPPSSLWSLKQASVRRKNLEASSNALKSRLTNLQQLNSRQEHQIESYLEELKEQQKQTEILLHSPPPPSENSSHGHKIPGLTRMSSMNTDISAMLPPLSVTDSEASVAVIPELPLQQWNNSDVLQWLAASGLYRFSDKFFAQKVTGRDLSEISMQFLDTIGIESLEDREILLSKLYELQHPGEPSLEEVLRNKSDSGNNKQKMLPSGDRSVKSPSGESTTSTPVSSKRSAVMMGTRMVTPKDSRESPWTPASTRKSRSLSVEDQKLAEQNVMIWHQLGGTTTSSYVPIDGQTTCYDTVLKLLHQQRVTDDPNLFFIVDKETSGREIEVSKFESMADLQHKWDNPMAHKLELKQKSGIQIKVTYKASSHEPRTKSFRVATCSSYSEVLLVACRKFKINQYGLFVLLELNRATGSVNQIPIKKNISELLSDCFLLCEKTAISQAETLAKWLKDRRASISSQTSSNISDTASQATVTSSRVGQFHGIEAQMANMDDDTYMVESEDDDTSAAEIETENSPYPIYRPGKFHSKSSYDLLRANDNGFDESPLKPTHRHFRSVDDFDTVSDNHKGFHDGGYQPKRRVMSAGNDLDRAGVNTPRAIELLQELSLLKESLKERDITILDLKKEYKDMKAKNHEMIFDQNRLKSLEAIFQEKQQSWQAKTEELQNELHQIKQEQLEKDPEMKIKVLEGEIEISRSNIWKKEEEIGNIKTDLEEHANSESPQAKLVEYLQSQLSEEENSLLTLKQEHGDMLLDLENTKKKLQLKNISSTLDLYTLIGSDKPPCLHALELAPKNGSYGLIIGRDKEKRLMVRHTEEGRPILKGDRLIEVNGRLVAKMEDEEIANFLKNAKEKSGCLKLVVLREFDPMKNHIAKEEHEALKEDLSLALMELESVQQENSDLTSDVKTLEKSLKNMTRERDELDKELKSIKSEENGNPIIENGIESVTFAEASPHKRLQLMLDTINAGKPQAQAVTSSQLRRGASRRGLDWFNTLVNVDRLDQVLAYDELDEKLPLYESMKIAPKEDVLQALKDTILETHQQKAYLDKLMGLVIDHAPYLLKSVDSSMGLEDDLLSIKSRTEERC